MDPSTKTSLENKQQKSQEPTTSNVDPDSWRDVVQRRIDSKTRRFGQGRTKPDPKPTENRFSAVAGYFFYPLMKNFDRLFLQFAELFVWTYLTKQSCNTSSLN